MALVATIVQAASGLASTAAQPRTPANGRECVMLQALDASAPIVSDPAECAVKTAPASTFKIPHALIALETGVLTDRRQTFEWDGTKQPFAAWERNHSLDSAIKSSVVWFFRRTAALIGRNRMVDYLKKFAYSGDAFDGELTSFWLNGDLVVSPEDQLGFMRRLVRYELPATRRHIDTVKEALLMPRGGIQNASGTHEFALTWPEPLVLRAKTGNTTVGNERVSWLVGHLETGRRQYVFVSRVRADGPLPGTAGADLARRVLNAHAQNVSPEEWARADAETRRLTPAEFRELSEPLRVELGRRGCTIPQTYTGGAPHNVVRGRFRGTGQLDVAVLCSRERVSSILVFWGGDPGNVSDLAAEQDAGFLQTVGPGRIGFSRALAVATPQTIRERYESSGESLRSWVSHDGIEDAFVEKASVVWYWREGSWLQLRGVD